MAVIAGLDPDCPGDPLGAERLLHAALRPGREALLRCLLGLQADGRPQLACGTCRPLHVAALAERLQASPLLHAVRRSSLEGMSCLLAAGCPPGAVPAGTGQPPLVAAASRLDAARCRLLIAAKAPAWEVDRQGQSALDALLSLCTDAQLVSWASCPGDEQVSLDCVILWPAACICPAWKALQARGWPCGNQTPRHLATHPLYSMPQRQTLPTLELSK